MCNLKMYLLASSTRFKHCMWDGDLPREGLPRPWNSAFARGLQSMTKRSRKRVSNTQSRDKPTKTLKVSNNGTAIVSTDPTEALARSRQKLRIYVHLLVVRCGSLAGGRVRKDLVVKPMGFGV